MPNRWMVWSTKITELTRGFLASARRLESSGCEPRIIAYVRDDGTRRFLESSCSDIAWTLRFAGAREVAKEHGNWKSPTVIVFERELPGADWREAFRTFRKLSPRPYVILLSRTTDLNLWDEMERVGGADILRTPLLRDRLLWAIDRASFLWHSRQQVDLPATRTPGGSAAERKGALRGPGAPGPRSLP